MQDQSQKDLAYTKDILSSKVIYIRHGETSYNKDSHEADKKSDMELIEIKYNEKYLDCKLNENGIKQSEELRSTLNTININKVYCSPLNRCIQTCIYSLAEHPQKDSIEIIIIPEASEIIHTIHDGCCDLEEKKKFFKKETKLKINWELMNGLSSNYNYKFMDQKPYISNKENTDQKDDKLFDNENENYGLFKFSEIMKASFSHTKRRVESLKHAFKRSIRLKETIENENKEFLSNTENNGKILIFSHSGFIKISTLRKNYNWSITDMENDKYPEISYKPNNCEAVGINITV